MRMYVVKVNTHCVTDLGMGRENASEDFTHAHAHAHTHAHAQAN